MSRWRSTIELADFIYEVFLEGTEVDEITLVPFDDLAEAWRHKRMGGGSLRRAQAHIEVGRAAAKEVLEEQGWTLTGATEYFFIDLGGVIPEDDDELFKCVPGLAGARPMTGWVASKGRKTNLAYLAYWRDINSGNAKVRKNTGAMADALTNGHADPVSVAMRNDQAELLPTMKEMRRVDKASTGKKVLALKP